MPRIDREVANPNTAPPEAFTLRVVRPDGTRVPSPAGAVTFASYGSAIAAAGRGVRATSASRSMWA